MATLHRSTDPVYKNLDHYQGLLGSSGHIDPFERWHPWAMPRLVLRAPGFQRVFPHPSPQPDDGQQPRNVPGFLYTHPDIVCGTAGRNGWPTLISRLKYHCGTEEWTVPSPCLWCELDGALCTVRSPTVVLGPVPDDESLLLLTTIRCGPFPASRTIEASDASAAPPHTEAGRVSHPSQAPLTLPTPKDTDSTPTDFLAPPPAAPLLTSGLPARAAAQNARAAISAQAKPAPLRLRRSKRRRAPSVSSAGSSVVEVEPPDQVVALKAKVLRLEAELASVRGAVERVRTDHAGLAARAKKTVTALTAANGLLQHVAKSEAEHSAECTAARERTSAQYAAVEHAVHTATEDITALKAAGAAAAKVPSPQPHADPSVAFRIASLEAQVHGLLSERAARQS